MAAGVLSVARKSDNFHLILRFPSDAKFVVVVCKSIRLEMCGVCLN